MAHPDTTGAADAPAPMSASDKAADFENYLFEDEQEDGSEPDPEGDEDIDPEALEEGDEEQADEDDEPDVPAIEAPVSLNAKEKKVFAQLPPEAQQAWAASESRRNQQVQEATTKASAAQREAEARAAAADAEAKGLYAKQLRDFVGAFEPTQPDPNLAYQDPARYVAEKAQYDAAKAQHDALVQQISGVAEEANTEAQAAFIAQRDRELMNIPEIANPETRAAAVERAMNTAKELGYDTEQLARFGDANDIKALLQIAELKAKADKYDRAISKQMQKVRAAKQRNLRPNAAPQAQSRNAQASKAWERVKTTNSREAKADAFADYLEASGLA